MNFPHAPNSTNGMNGMKYKETTGQQQSERVGEGRNVELSTAQNVETDEKGGGKGEGILRHTIANRGLP